MCRSYVNGGGILYAQKNNRHTMVCRLCRWH